MKKYLYIIVATLSLLMTSCVSQREVNRNYSSPFRPNVIRLDMTMDDYEYLGQVTVEVEYKLYLGIFKKNLTINGENYNPRQFRVTNLNLYPYSNTSVFRKALYKVVDLYPNADYIVLASKQKEIQHMFGGRIVKETMTVKVFSVRSAKQ